MGRAVLVLGAALVAATLNVGMSIESVRADYQALLKRAGENPAVEEALRDRLSRVTRHEQAARAARTIQTILARSWRRDLQVAQVRQRLAAAEQSRTRTYSAIGFVQPSSRMVEGRKVYALVGSDGSTLASDRGAGTAGFVGTVHDAAVEATGLTTLPGDGFGSGPSVPMVPGTWVPDQEGPDAV